MPELLESAHYEKQAQFENSINILLQLIDRARTNVNPFMPELFALYDKIKPAINDSDCEKLYETINTKYNISFDHWYKGYYLHHSRRICLEDQPEDWSYKPDYKIKQAALLKAWYDVKPDCDKLYTRIIQKLKEQNPPPVCQLATSCITNWSQYSTSYDFKSLLFLSFYRHLRSPNLIMLCIIIYT